MKEKHQRVIRFLSNPLFVVTRRRIFLALAVLFLASLFLYSFRNTFLVRISELLIENHPVKRTELLLILGGDVTSTVDYAASIYDKVQPSLILVSPNSRAKQVVGRLAKLHHLPRDRIEILPSPRVVTSTYEEAIAMGNYSQRVPFNSVTIITVTFHTGRAYWIFRRILPKDVEVRVVGAPEEGFAKSNWWKTEGGLIAVNNEFLKWAYYWWKYAGVNTSAGTIHGDGNQAFTAPDSNDWVSHFSDSTSIDCSQQALLDAINTANSGGGGTIRFNCQNTTILMSQGLGVLQDNIIIDGENKDIVLEYTTDFTGCFVGDGFPSGDVPIAQVEGQNNVIRGLIFKNFLESIQLKGPNNTIADNTFLGHTCSDDALSSITTNALNNSVRNNHFQDYADKAFQMSYGGGSIVNNTFLDTQQPIRGPYDNSLGETILITGNQFLTTGDTSECTGVTIDGTYRIRFEGNTLKCQRGLRIGGQTEIIIDNNTIEGNDRVGIRIGGNAVASIANNRVTNNGLAGGSLPAGGIVVWGNAQADLGGGSLVIDGQTVSSSGNNIIQGNGLADVRNLRAGYLLKAENNCWDNQVLTHVQNLDSEGDVDVDPLSCTSSSE